LPSARANTDVGVKIDVVGGCGTIFLDRPRALNALTTPMVRAIYRAMKDFADASTIEVVAMASTRPGTFCAGGDIRAVREARLEGRHGDADTFFSEEYALNQYIATFPKPYVALIDGICMGGGLGLSVHGAHRVVSDRLTMSMPETSIGLFPDIGASFFLNRLPGQLGLYLAMTGARVTAADALYCGLATAHIDKEKLPELHATLAAVRSGDVSATIDRFTTPITGPSQLREQRDTIDRCFQSDTVQNIVGRLQDHASEFTKTTLGALHAASPASLQITLELFQRTKTLDLGACQAIEFDLVCAVTRTYDFAEGVRAVLVDKDRNPRWASAGRPR
jgi:enoyl-CoA hydratase